MLQKGSFAILKLHNYHHIEEGESRPPLELYFLKARREADQTPRQFYKAAVEYLYPGYLLTDAKWESVPVEEPAHMYSDYIQYSFEEVQPSEFSLKMDVRAFESCWWIQENATGIEQYLFVSESFFLLIRSEDLS